MLGIWSSVAISALRVISWISETGDSARLQKIFFGRAICSMSYFVTPDMLPCLPTDDSPAQRTLLAEVLRQADADEFVAQSGNADEAKDDNI